MGKSYSGDQIVAKVRRVSRLIEQGKPLQEVCSSLQISRQTYDRWKGICDSIQSELESRTKKTAKQIDLLKKENRQLKSKLEKVQDQASEYKRQLDVAEQRLGTLSDLQDQLTQSNNARKSSDIIIEHLKAQLSRTDRKLQERTAINETV